MEIDEQCSLSTAARLRPPAPSGVPWQSPPPRPSRSALLAAPPLPPCLCASTGREPAKPRRALGHSCWAVLWPRRSWCWRHQSRRCARYSRTGCRKAAAAPPPPHAVPHMPLGGAGTAHQPCEKQSPSWQCITRSRAGRAIAARQLGRPPHPPGGRAPGPAVHHQAGPDRPPSTPAPHFTS